jgi:transposase
MFIWPIDELIDDEKAYTFLCKSLPPEGVHCPQGHKLPAEQAPHTTERAPVVTYRCRQCGAVFHIFSGTALHGIRYPCRTIVLMLRGFAQGTPTAHLAAELGCDYSNLLSWRHQLQDLAEQMAAAQALSDTTAEVDEVYQNAGHKGEHPADAEAPPRSRANKARGRGTADSDRPPIVGLVGRDSRQIRLTVAPDTRQETVMPFIEAQMDAQATLFTDEHPVYDALDDSAHSHAAVSHADHEFARDDSGDGERTVHINSVEGIWTALRNFLRPFRGLHQRYLPQYVALFQITFNWKRFSLTFLKDWLNPLSP